MYKQMDLTLYGIGYFFLPQKNEINIMEIFQKKVAQAALI